MTDRGTVPPSPSAPSTTHASGISDQDIAALLDRAQGQLFHATTYIAHGLYKPAQWERLARTLALLGTLETTARERAQPPGEGTPVT